LSQKDIEGTQRFSTADGNISEGTIINLNKVEFGGISLTNIKASVVNSQQAPLLLGQSVLKKLGRYEIDNDRKVIKIYYKNFK
jgi:predicted aspartyl protease